MGNPTLAFTVIGVVVAVLIAVPALFIAIRSLHWGKRGALASEQENAMHNAEAEADRNRDAADVAATVVKAWVLTREGTTRTIFGLRVNVRNRSRVPDLLMAACVEFQGTTYATDVDGAGLLCYLDEGARRPYAKLPVTLKEGEPIALWLEFKVPGVVGSQGEQLPAKFMASFERAKPDWIDFVIAVGI